MYQPQFTINNAILMNIAAIEASREVINNAPLLPYYEKQFQEDAIVRTVHHGTHIEGNELNIDQAEQVLAGQSIMARSRDIQEVMNYRSVMDYINELQNEKQVSEIDEHLIRKIHGLTVINILEPEFCGVFRKTQVVVKNSLTGAVTFRPPAAIEIPYQMREFLQWIHSLQRDDIHPVLKAGIVHYELVRIHPFLDGNGRVARAISTYTLFKENYDIRKFFSIEEYFDSDAASYYKALQSVEEEDGSLTSWLSYFTKGLAIELTKVKEKVQKLSIDVKLKDKLGKQIALSSRQIKIIEYIQKVGYLQNQAFDSLFPMISEDTILRELQELVAHGIIKKEGVTKGAKYVLHSYVD